MNQKILRIYREIRANPTSMLVGRDAEMALRDARTIHQFQQLESDGLVRIQADHEIENHFDVYGEECLSKREDERTEDLIERWGCWYVYTEWFDGGKWQHADSIGMCIYLNPTSYKENCYVPQLMASAIKALEDHQSAITETQYAEIYP